ncbi:MAG: C39 family peptidase [Candidatus Bathyarchaeota archaeon]|nr:MAG: C39 family peptidase [Candidatus Bathyarchaeota archaeon]
MNRVFSTFLLAFLTITILASLELVVVLAADAHNEIEVPFHYQATDYYCGPACAEMVFDYYGEDISQFEIADVARTDPEYMGTYTVDMVRAGHFSNQSTSVGNEQPGSITGYSLRKIGYASFERWDLTINDLKTLINGGYPVILLMWYGPTHGSGHYRVAIDYNETHMIVHDPWPAIGWGGEIGGPNVAFNYSTFLDLWEYSGYWGMISLPWSITISHEPEIYRDEVFSVTANATYPCPSPFWDSDYPASAVNFTIGLSDGLNLTFGESARKSVGNLQAGQTASVSWDLEADTSGNKTINIEVGGIVEGSVFPNPPVYPGYDYEDLIGASANFTLEIIGYIHDVAITDLNSKTCVGEGLECSIHLSVMNEGEFTEEVNITVYANSTIIQSQNITLRVGQLIILDITWDTTSCIMGNYTLLGYALPVPNENDTADNTLEQGWILLTVAGDVNGDQITDITDITMTVSNYGKTSNSPGWHEPDWYVNCDMNNDNIIDITDLVLVIGEFGNSW